MKRKGMAVALAGIATAAGAMHAHAQSSVTLYGVVDSGIT